MKKYKIISLSLALVFLVGCKNPFRNPFSSGGDSATTPPAQPARVIEATSKFMLAIGGVLSGRDELVIHDTSGNIRDFSGHELVCSADDDIVILKARPGYTSQAAGSGVQIVATDPGVTAIRCKVDGTELEDVYEVTIPPQNLIQILVAEAGQQLIAEADIDSTNNAVRLDSSSPTGNALGSVIRNRVELINQQKDPALFAADPNEYDAAPPASYYDAVILAKDQFSPTDPKDLSYGVFDDAQDRDFLSGDWVTAYDQAVLTAAWIFNGDITDSTGGAFAFRSPTAGEWSTILSAWTTFSMEVPEDSGFTDADFPGLAPIQLLICPDVWKYDGSRPSFIFARRRTLADFAVVNTP